MALGLLYAADRDPSALFSDARAKMLASANRAIEYTCVQTVERKFYQSFAGTAHETCPLMLTDAQDPAKAWNLRLTSTDRLRLDVTVAKLGEIFSWAGESRFEDRGIDTVVRDGPIGSGSFASFLNMILWHDVQEFRYDGHRLSDGRDLMEYSFRVAQADSRYYHVKFRQDWEATGYFGSIFLEPGSGNVVRLHLETVRPDIGPSCQTASTLDFSTNEDAALPFVLPKRARQVFLTLDGNETENISTFSNCREYRGESTIKFEAPSETEANRSPSQNRVEVAAGTSFSLALLDPIDSNAAAAGDSFRATLRGTLRDTRKRVIGKTGDVVSGRIRRVQMNVWPRAVYLVLAPTELQTGEERIELAADAETSRGGKGTQVMIPRVGEGHGGVFEFRGANVVVPAGFESAWRTVKVEEK